MTATARRFNITEEMSQKPTFSGGSWDEVPVPNNYKLRCVSADDYDKSTPELVKKGWVLHYEIPTSTGPCTFNIYLSFNVKARWKMIEVFKAHGYDIHQSGVRDADPNWLVGEDVGGFVDFPRDGNGQPTSKYRDILEFFPLVEEEEELGSPVDPGPDPVEPEPTPPTELEEPEVL